MPTLPPRKPYAAGRLCNLHSEQYEAVSKILYYLGHMPTKLAESWTYGRANLPRTCVVHWALLMPKIRERLTIGVFPTPRREKERVALGISKRSHSGKWDYRAWEERRGRELFEQALGPLIVPPTSSLGSASVAVYANACPDVGYAHQPNAPSWASCLFDATAYTVLQKVNVERTAIARTLFATPTPAPALDQALAHGPGHDHYCDAIPQPLQLLYAAWSALCRRGCAPFDPAVVGLHYTVNGFVAVNWRAFITSNHLTDAMKNNLTVTPDSLFRFFEGPGLRSYVAKDAVMTAGDRSADRQRLLLETDVFTEEDLPFITLFDPLKFCFKQKIFSGTWHLRQKDHVQQRVIRRREALQRATGRQSGVTAKVYTYNFHPWSCLADSERHSAWFGEDHTETIYVIEKKGQFFFSRPALLDRARREAPTEVEAWYRTIESLKLVEKYYEDGTIEVVPQPKSRFYANIRRSFLEKVARQVIEEFTCLDDLRRRDYLKVKMAAKREYFKENPEIGEASRWYYDLIDKHCRGGIDKLSEIRRTARVVLKNDEQPVNMTFYSLRSIKLFKTIAEQGAFTGAEIVGEAREISRLSETVGGPAFYLQAWCRFCIDTAQKGREFAANYVRSKFRWAPDEDFLLLTNYHRYPKMRGTEWDALLDKLPGRDISVCRQRINTINMMLQPILNRVRVRRHKAGCVWGDATRAKRIILLVAYARAISNMKDPLIVKIMNLTPEWLERLPLPPTYVGSYFEKLEF